MEAVTVTKHLKKISAFIFLCLLLNGCSHTQEPIKTSSLLQDAPQKDLPTLKTQETPTFCYFIPPKGWDLADQTKLSPRVKICFLGKSPHNLLPSVNLATEEVDISLKTYLDIVKKDCESDPNCQWRDLGKYQTPLGEGRLTEREVQTQWGVSRQVQLIVIKDKIAYILTAGSLKEEFSRHYKDFEGVLRSFTITNNLTDQIASTEKKSTLHQLIEKLQSDFKNTTDKIAVLDEAFESSNFQKESWEPFQEKIINDFTEMGPYWQILLLRDLQYQLLQN